MYFCKANLFDIIQYYVRIPRHTRAPARLSVKDMGLSVVAEAACLESRSSKVSPSLWYSDFKEKYFSPSLVRKSVLSGACSASDRKGWNFEYHPQEVILARFSLNVHEWA